ncbi:Serine/threonine-protein kinase atr, partial [Sarcoptes scabiei]
CVPFRLTQNMLSAMGVLGCDGPFRSTCEDVLLVLRQFREIFSQPITVFLYDTLSDWSNPSDRTEIAEKSVFNVEARLFGITLRTNRRLPKGNVMSISGQIDHIIKEATDLNNLGAMYHGWASFI